MHGIAAHRAVTRRISKDPTLVEIPSISPGNQGCRGVEIVANVPCLVRFEEKVLEAKKDGGVSVAVGDPNTIYLPADVPRQVVGSRSVMYIRTLDKDGVFCAAPLSM